MELRKPASEGFVEWADVQRVSGLAARTTIRTPESDVNSRVALKRRSRRSHDGNAIYKGRRLRVAKGGIVY